MEIPNKNLLSELTESLYEKGWWVSEHFIPVELAERLVEEEKQHWKQDQFHQARVGAGSEKQLRSEIRSDRVLWLDPGDLSSTQEEYWNLVDELRVHLNREFYVGAQYFEGHFAVYPPGSFYKKHFDQFHGNRSRLITCILYLNRNWQPTDGGQLRIYTHPSDDNDYIDIEPRFGIFVCFRSDTIPHEVLPANRDRFSLTGWLRRE